MANTGAAVLDTNVWLDWLVFNDGSIAPLAAAFESGRLTLLATSRVRAELADVVHRPYFSNWSRQNRPSDAGSPGQWLAHFDAVITPCEEPPSGALICSDADDQVFIDLALARKAQWLLSRDRALLKLARKAAASGVRITTPAGFECNG